MHNSLYQKTLVIQEWYDDEEFVQIQSIKEEKIFTL